MQNTEWSSGLFDICAMGFGTCLYTTYCGPCAYADLKSEFAGEGWFGACMGAICCLPCHDCCWHPELRRQIATKHGKNVSSSRNSCLNFSYPRIFQPDDPCNACLVTCLCSCCATIQERKQIQSNPGAGQQVLIQQPLFSLPLYLFYISSLRIVLLYYFLLYIF
jgi:hypothetical protein